MSGNETLTRDWPTGGCQNSEESSVRQLSQAQNTISLNHFLTAETSIIMFHEIEVTARYLNNEPSFYLAPLILMFSSLSNQFNQMMHSWICTLLAFIELPQCTLRRSEMKYVLTSLSAWNWDYRRIPLYDIIKLSMIFPYHVTCFI